jgi:hypothetical protein
MYYIVCRLILYMSQFGILANYVIKDRSKLYSNQDFKW